jgi:methionyl-tRNA formyltransferase
MLPGMRYNSAMTPTTPPARTRIVFLGTPAFAVPALAALYEGAEAHNWQLAGVATQPDRPAGRGKQVAASPVKQYAVERGLPVLQPQSLRKDPGAAADLAALAPDLLVVAAYGLILPPSVLTLPTFGCINVHASLLPAYRGASPITAAILEGRTETGITIMLMDEGMDTGPALRQAASPILPTDTTASLSARLADLGAQLLVQTLPDWLDGRIAPIRQSELGGEASGCRLIKKEHGQIDWSQEAAAIERMVRAYTPWPTAYSTWRGEIFKILAAAVLEGSAPPGVVAATAAGPAVGTGAGLLLLQTVQAAGKRAMPAAAFANGAAGFVGGRLGE